MKLQREVYSTMRQYLEYNMRGETCSTQHLQSSGIEKEVKTDGIEKEWRSDF